ncbi:hypothetical protein DFJ73DRAFT_806682 [Zopfochytrium polystomum]|nr:hypothetical protein DFJ73DRAFT_806682 [Zopfochytrium polystomum]
MAGASSGGGSSSRRHNPMAANRPIGHRPAASGGATEVVVRGWRSGNPDVDTLMNFIHSKVEIPVNVVGIRTQGDDAFIRTSNIREAQAIFKLSGIRYAGSKLLVSPARMGADGRSRQNVPQEFNTTAIPTLTSIIQSRYNAVSKFLNLDNLDADPAMASHPALSGFGGNVLETSKIGPVLCKLIGQICPDVLTISLQSNRLTSLRPFQTLSQYCLLLQNLSFRDNQIQSFREIEPLKGNELKNLREIMFTGNPVRDRETRRTGGEAAYRSKIKQMFPTIQILDQADFEDEIAIPSVEDNTVKELQDTEKDSFLDSPVTADMIQDFIPKFFSLFDKNRTGLFDLYADQAQFSVSVDMEPRFKRSGPAAKSRNSMRYDNFDRWLPFNRNHVTTTDPGRRGSYLAAGPTAIGQAFARLPTTLHPTSSPAEKKMFVADAFQLPMPTGVMLIFTLHGEFTDVELHKARSFSRTFTIIPPPPGSRAAQAGWQYAILNDMLVVRSWAQDRVWMSKPSSPQSAVPTNGPLVGVVLPKRGAPNRAMSGMLPTGQPLRAMSGLETTGAPVRVMSGIEEPLSLDLNPAAGALPNDPAVLYALMQSLNLTAAQHELVCQLARETGLNYQFAAQCLSQTDWEPPKAMEAFLNVRATIPSEAFTFIPPQ